MGKAKKGDKVKVHYTGTLEDGEVFDTSEGKDPLEFVIGDGSIIKGFDDAVTGMDVGEEKEIELEAGDAYGEPREELVQEVPKDAFGDQLDPKEGMMIALKAPTGQTIPAKIKEVKDATVIIDLNHPLAGKKLKFKIKVEEVSEGPHEVEKPAEEAPAEEKKEE